MACRTVAQGRNFNIFLGILQVLKQLYDHFREYGATMWAEAVWPSGPEDERLFLWRRNMEEMTHLVLGNMRHLTPLSTV